MINHLEHAVVISCYAGNDYPGDINAEMAHPIAMAYVANSVCAAGADVIRTNLVNVREIKKMVTVPVIGIQKIPHPTVAGDFRITPTMREVDLLVEAGADGIAIDGTFRPRYDELTFEQFVHSIKEKYPDLTLIADISTLEEGMAAWEAGVDYVGTTLSGYTSYSKNPIVFGTIPTPEPDYELIEDLRNNGVTGIIAEGRFHTGEEVARGFEAGANAVVVGTSVTSPKKILGTLLYDMKCYEENR
ncbi:MAG: putative N-acetylmannosamine-6-phosphate 2-epimerase [Erysipelotrichaceae bacterium]|nr:putative N-acetylmannosamine-6-phosphate 2-epimerase [Erysipelotrichaceae bacterium]